jgi:ribosomal protein S18 acetylase RimI-like enzyme
MRSAVVRGSTLCAREYRAEDLPRALDIFDSNVPEFFTTAERQVFEDFLQELPGPYFVVETTHGELVACGGYAVVLEHGRADLCWGMVSRTHHGQGVGRFLTALRLEAATADARVRAVVLNTSHLTRGFYERLGFTVERVAVDGIAPGVDRCDMRLELLR